MKKSFYIILISTIAISCSSSVNSLNENSLHGRWELVALEIEEETASQQYNIDSIADLLLANPNISFQSYRLYQNGDTSNTPVTSISVNDAGGASKEQVKGWISGLNFTNVYSSSNWQTLPEQGAVMNFREVDGVNMVMNESNSSQDYEYRILNEDGNKRLQTLRSGWDDIMKSLISTSQDYKGNIESFQNGDKLTFTDYTEYSGSLFALFDPQLNKVSFLCTYDYTIITQFELRSKD